MLFRSNPGQPGIPAVPGNQPKPGTASQSFGSAPPAGPLYDGVAAAQNELKLASDSARAAVERSTNAINSGVYQAGARLDRIGSGVVQATGILESSISGPLPTGASGSLSDMPKDAGDLQWRKPQ